MPDQLAETIHDRYVLERELGRGGMATVYLARDLKHKRPVALKVLRPELAASLGPERFQREIEFAARLQHPHILTVLDSGSVAGQLWFTMPYVEGESLRTRLTREGQLPIEAALRIAREAAEALQYAHDHGVIHRDVKPENLLLTTDGNTLVADFGIARALGGTGESGEPLTETGLSLGTPRYMSPEQASAEKAVDARTDVYSLGCVLYEMLAGEPPFTGRTLQAIIAKQLSGSVPSVRQVRPSVTLALDQALQRALASVPADRFGSMAEFARALVPAQSPETVLSPAVRRRGPTLTFAVLGVAFLLGLGALFAWHRKHSTDARSAGPKVLAVLPFENLGDSADDYFADGITDEVRTKLSKISGLQVIARGSSNEYRNSPKRPQEIARELGVAYLLTGTIRWEKVPGSTSRVRVTPELVAISPRHTPRTSWGEQFDAALTDVFEVQTEIAGKVASALDVALGENTRRDLTVKPTENLAAYDAFLRGEAISHGMAALDAATLRRAIRFYDEAVTLDSSFVAAWAQLARAHSTLYSASGPTPEAAAQARQAAQRARALGPNRPEAYLALGAYHRLVRVDNPEALAVFQAGLRVAPSNVDLLVDAARIEWSLGRWETALPQLARVAALDPLSATTARRYAYALLALRRYAEADSASERALALAPTDLYIIELRAMVALAQGDLARARTVVSAGLRRVEPAALLPYVANYEDLYWVLDDVQQQQVLTLPPSAFDNDRGQWGIVRAQIYRSRGDAAKARIYADSARLAFDEQLRAAPGDGQRHVLRGLALAYLGRPADAIREGKLAVAFWPISRDAHLGPYVQHQLARIYLLVGEVEKALDQLEPLLKIPYYLSPGWLRIDPNFAPLRGNARFERLLAGR